MSVKAQAAYGGPDLVGGSPYNKDGTLPGTVPMANAVPAAQQGYAPAPPPVGPAVVAVAVAAPAGQTSVVGQAIAKKNWLITILTFIGAVMIFSAIKKDFLSCGFAVGVDPNGGVETGAASLPYNASSTDTCAYLYNPNTMTAQEGYDSCATQEVCDWYEQGKQEADPGTPACNAQDNRDELCGCGLNPDNKFNFRLDFSLNFVLAEAEVCVDIACKPFDSDSETPNTCNKDGTLNSTAIQQMTDKDGGSFPLPLNTTLQATVACYGLQNLTKSSGDSSGDYLTKDEVNKLKTVIVAVFVYPALLLILLTLTYLVWSLQKRNAMHTGGCCCSCMRWYGFLTASLLAIAIGAVFYGTAAYVTGQSEDGQKLTFPNDADTPAGKLTWTGPGGQGDNYACSVGEAPKLQVAGGCFGLIAAFFACRCFRF